MEQNNLEDKIKKIEKEKQERKERSKDTYRSIRAFSMITSIISNFIGTILLGVVVGYLLTIWTENNIWMVVGIIVFFLIAVIGFFIRMGKLK